MTNSGINLIKDLILSLISHHNFLGKRINFNILKNLEQILVTRLDETTDNLIHNLTNFVNLINLVFISINKVVKVRLVGQLIEVGVSLIKLF